MALSQETIDKLWDEITDTSMPMVGQLSSEIFYEYRMLENDYERGMYGTIGSSVFEHSFNFMYFILCAEGEVKKNANILAVS